jgi:hypothetical protein
MVIKLVITTLDNKDRFLSGLFIVDTFSGSVRNPLGKVPMSFVREIINEGSSVEVEVTGTQDYNNRFKWYRYHVL